MTKHIAHKLCSNNPYGTAGIILICGELYKGERYVNWQSSWVERGEQIRMTRSIRRYGYEGAFNLVAKARFDAVGGELPTVPAPPDWLEEWFLELQKTDQQKNWQRFVWGTKI